jgi:hypothetical protein
MEMGTQNYSIPEMKNEICEKNSILTSGAQNDYLLEDKVRI